MQQLIWVRVLAVVVTGLSIIALAWLMILLFVPKIGNTASLSLLGKGHEPTTTTSSTQALAVIADSSLSIKIDQLATCESSNNPNALNPKDSNGLPSMGLFQFQSKSWKYFVDKYKLWNTSNWSGTDYANTIYNSNMQLSIVQKMFVDPTVNLHQQFPTCSKKLQLEITYAYCFNR
jgi:hypothetical protein